VVDTVWPAFGKKPPLNCREGKVAVKIHTQINGRTL